MAKKIYIAGKITNENIGAVKTKFAIAERKLRGEGYITINPTRYGDYGITWAENMKICIKKLVECDCLYLLPDWIDSKGAILEKQIAEALQLEIITEIKWNIK